MATSLVAQGMDKVDSRKIYYLAVYSDKNGGYWTKFADFDCLYDQGDTLDEALRNSTSLISAFLDDLAKSDCRIPEPCALDDFLARLDPLDGEPACVVPIAVCSHIGRSLQNERTSRIP